MDEVITAISTVGFPIVCSLILGYLLLTENRSHKEEMLQLRQSIESNTLVMTELKLLISELRKDVKDDTSREV